MKKSSIEIKTKSKTMQESQKIHDYYSEDNQFKHFKVIKHMRSHDMNDRIQYVENQSLHDNSRSMSSSLRHSIRHLTSCASAR